MIAVCSAIISTMGHLSPERRAALVHEWFLEQEPEVKLARKYIAADDLAPEFAEELLAFARDLAERRMAS